MSEIQQEFDRLVTEAEAEMLWEYRLIANEMLHGSAYGPWPKPQTSGLAAMILDGG